MKQTFIKSAMLLLLILSMATTRAQEVALKTNLLGWASTSANAGIEIGMGKKTTFQLFGTLNPWKFSGDKKMRFWNVMPEYRWYTCQFLKPILVECESDIDTERIFLNQILS